jgi:hypothetical protein
MAETGGAAVALGIWYQSIGAAIALTWTFDGAEPSADGESNLGVANADELELVLEHFDMDAVTKSDRRANLIQFKATSRREPEGFGWVEVRDIFRNATQAILRLESPSTVPINNFIVASNRPIGPRFNALQTTLKSLRSSNAGLLNPESLSEFAEIPAPFRPSDKEGASEDESDSTLAQGSADTIPPGEDSVMTMRDLAKRIIWGKATDWGFTVEQCIKACLRALARFAFVPARPEQLKKKFEQWLATWGILQDEYNRYMNSILGELLNQSRDGSTSTALSIMRRVLGSSKAVPFTPHYIWPAVVDELRSRVWPDPPTERPIRNSGFDEWMLDRSALLRGLPYDFQDSNPDPDSEDYSCSDLAVWPRIFALVGPGGAGKSMLMAHLFNQIAAAYWDWKAGALREEGPFLGCPIIQDAEINAIDGIASSLTKWGWRRGGLELPVERIAVAYGIENEAPAVWFGVDGLDEVLNEHLRPLAKAIASYADRHRGVRFVLTCRPDQFRRVERDLNTKCLMRRLDIDVFDEDEARKAISEATENKVQVSTRFSSLLLPGSATDIPSLSSDFERQVFEDSIRQPLFVGAVHKVYLRGELETILRASDDDPDALRILLREYMYLYCLRAERRLNKPYINARHVFKAIRHLVTEIENPAYATSRDWVNVCEKYFNSAVQWFEFYTQCDASGLIRELRSGAFEWKLALVPRYLPDIEEPEWP